MMILLANLQMKIFLKKKLFKRKCKKKMKKQIANFKK